MTAPVLLPPRQRGVSLIEALVALVVMAFGILGVAGLQASLRGSADISKQRSEGVRIAQEAIERWRAYSVLPVTAGQAAYEDIVADTSAETVSGYTTNTTYTVFRSVVDARATDSAEPRMRTLVVDVSWADRAGQTQHVVLDTSIAGVSPELAGSLGIPGEGAPTQLPGGRNPSIPPGAVNNESSGTSIFTPPNGSGTTWTFNNTTGVITRICNPGCVDVTAFLLSGYIRFSLGSTAPTGANAETPVDAIPSGADVVISIALTVPSAMTLTCYKQDFTTYVAYYCAVPVTTTVPIRWSGQSRVSGLTISSALADFATDSYKVCRYTPGRNEDVNADGVADGDKPLNGNIDHPLTYTNVTGPLVNQNFLVIRAGDGIAAPFDCPGDDTSTPLFNGNTWRHQPTS